MTCENATEIRRCADGTIDFAFYQSRARRLHGEAFMRASSDLGTGMRRLVCATGRIVWANLTPARHAHTGRSNRPDARHE